jgi:hypothetical protein
VYWITPQKKEGIAVIFRRRRVRIEIEENTLTLGPVETSSTDPLQKNVPATVQLSPPSSPEHHLPPAREVESTPKGTRHVR